MSEQKLKEAHVVTDEMSGNEALCVDGVLVDQEPTIYASEIATAVGEVPCRLTVSNVELDDSLDWPGTFDGVAGTLSRKELKQALQSQD